ncbi:helix-turn-helix domain-containing protein [Elusimicrobiota bacterium]
MARKIVKFRDYLKTQLKDPEFRKHYEAYDLPVRLAMEIAMLRKKKKMTQAQLARKMRVTQQFVAQLENAEKSIPSLRTLENVAHALNKQLYVGFQ